MLDINNVIKHLLMSKLTYLSTAKHTNKEYLTRSKDNKKNGENHSFKFFSFINEKCVNAERVHQGYVVKKTPPPREKRGVGVLIHGFQSIHNARHL